MNNLKNKIIPTAIGFLMGLSVTVFAASWQGVSWINNNSVIDSSKIASNFQYLYDKLDLFKCPAGQVLQEVNLRSGTKKCISRR
jgi:hypothetical protein